MIKGKQKELNVRLQMSRDNHRSWHLRIEDDDSGLSIIDIRLDHEQFSNLLSTMTTHPCKASYWLNEEVGRKLEVKRVSVDYSQLGKKIFEDYSESANKKDLKKVYDYAEQLWPGYTVDRDSFNSRLNDSNGKTYSVVLRKYENEAPK